MGKGSGRRPMFIPQAEYDASYERMFGKRERRKWDPPPLKPEPDEGKDESAEPSAV